MQTPQGLVFLVSVPMGTHDFHQEGVWDLEFPVLGDSNMSPQSSVTELISFSLRALGPPIISKSLTLSQDIYFPYSHLVANAIWCVPSKIQCVSRIRFWHCHTYSKLDSDTDAGGRQQHLNSTRSATRQLSVDLVSSGQFLIEFNLNQN